jgi:general secretion pathway protein M
MSKTDFITKYLERYPTGAAILYVAVVAAFVLVAVVEILDISERRAAVAATADILSQLDARVRPASGRPGVGEIAAVTGSPFLEGATFTLAGATLLQRVAGAVTKANGNILSSQVELQGPQAKDGIVSVTLSCEVEQPALQGLLYDIEAGMPFLFVDQVVAQGPATITAGPGMKLRVLLTVSGQWLGTK